MLVSSRSLAEYRAMFALTAADLERSIMDCPGGASSFTAELSAAGGRVVAADPTYARPAREVAQLSRDDMKRANDYQRRNPDEYVWTFFDGHESYLASRSRSVELFLADHTAHPQRYVAAALPALPFRDRAFDLALCSHLLFSYADRLDRAFHLAAIRELARVAAEVRVFPLVPMGQADSPELAAIVAGLTGAGCRATVHTVDYELQRGGNQMLRVAAG